MHTAVVTWPGSLCSDALKNMCSLPVHVRMFEFQHSELQRDFFSVAYRPGMFSSGGSRAYRKRDKKAQPYDAFLKLKKVITQAVCLLAVRVGCGEIQSHLRVVTAVPSGLLGRRGGIHK